jgi:hypothetical protein
MRCTICHHPQHQEIAVSLIRAGIRATARQFHISRASLDRHKKHLPQAMAKAQQAQELSEASALLSRVEEVLSDARRIARQAEEKGDLSTALSGLKTITHSLELFGKLSGELQTGTRVHVGIAVNTQGTQRTEAELELAIAQHVSAATNNFDATEIARLKAIAESTASPIR